MLKTYLREASSGLEIPLDVDSLGLIINEVLFNPKPGCSQYIELYNRGTKTIT